ncbi:uncharacterized protein LOC143300242 [Babylonia areolata]|uniref:uncharacterized protein LOC143300242 n=1 Tax=Babylonia areolata TaxID=304850 RepID=UPI003FD5FA74
MGPPKGRKRGPAEREKNLFKVQVKLIPTDEVFTLNQIHNDMKISELKEYLEFATGLPTHIQRVSYLDEGEMLDDTDVRSNDIVPGATLHLRVWPMWTTLIEAVAGNDIDHVMMLGVTNPTEYRSPNSDYMTKRARKAWLEERASVALSMAANRGLEKMCLRLIQSGADVNSATQHGRTALHIASAQGHGNIVDLLLEKGADIDAEDDYGETSLSIAERFGYKSCGRHLFLFHWQQRAKKVTPARNIPLKPHQKTDSLYPVWKRGGKAQLYVAQLDSPGEYEGTGLGAPKRGMHPSLQHKLIRDRVFNANVEESSRHESEEGDYFPDGTDSMKIELPPIHTDQQIKMRGGRVLKKPDTHQEWLQKIKDAEEKVNEEKRKLREEQKLKRLEEEEKKKEENERLGYERWLAQRQQEKADRLSRTVTATSRSRRDYTDREDVETEDGGPQTIGALRAYLRSLGRTKTGVPYEKWLNDKEREVNALPVGKLKAQA